MKSTTSPANGQPTPKTKAITRKEIREALWQLGQQFHMIEAALYSDAPDMSGLALTAALGENLAVMIAEKV